MKNPNFSLVLYLYNFKSKIKNLSLFQTKNDIFCQNLLTFGILRGKISHVRLKSVQHNGDYVVNTEEVRAVVFAVCVYHRFLGCIYGSYLCLNARECQTDEQCLFEYCNKSLQTSAWDCAEKPCLPQLLPARKAVSYSTKYLICQADCRFCLWKRNRFLFFAFLRIASTPCIALTEAEQPEFYLCCLSPLSRSSMLQQLYISAQKHFVKGVGQIFLIFFKISF